MSYKNDFYNYVNSKWLKKNPVPKKYSVWGSFHVLRDKNLKRLKKLISKKSEGKFKKLDILYKEFMNTKKLSIDPIVPYIDNIMKCKSKESLWNLLAKYEKMCFNPFFVFYPEIDSKKSDLVVLNLGSGGLGLPARSYYFDKSKSETRQKYKVYIKKILKLYFKNDKFYNKIFDLEKQLAKNTYTKLQMREPKLLYNKMTINGLKKVSNFEWNKFYDKVPYLIVRNPKFFKKFESIWKKTKLETLQYFISYKLISSLTGYLPDKYGIASFEFYDKFLSGIKQRKQRWERGISLVKSVFGELLGQLYIKEYFSKASKNKMLEMINDISQTLKERIKGLDWMSEKTKKKALLKEKHFTAKIGYPDKWKCYSSYKLNQNSLIDMLIHCDKQFYKKEQKTLFKKPDPNKWEMNVYDVNAYFHPLRNEIVFPAGILQKPFFDLNYSDEKNYGGIGSVIGHEMIHSYDDKGSMYDHLGNLKNWWSKEDLKKFNTKTKFLVDEFNKLSYKGTKLNGKLTLGENIADLGGITLAFYALLKKNPKNIKHFFENFANVEKSNITDKEAERRIRTDPHSLSIFRVNTILKNFKPFCDFYKLKKGDKMCNSKYITLW